MRTSIYLINKYNINSNIRYVNYNYYSEACNINLINNNYYAGLINIENLIKIK